MQTIYQFLISILICFLLMPIQGLAPKTNTAHKARIPQISEEYLLKKLNLLLNPGKKPLFIFDVHGTLLKSTWKKEYAALYSKLFHKTPSEEWFKKFIYQTNNDTIMNTLARQSGRDKEEVNRLYAEIRTFFRSGRPLEPISGGLEFIKDLKKMNFEIIISSRASKEVITKQLSQAGFLDYLEPANIIGCPDNLRSQYDRSKVMKQLQKKYPGHQIISFDDWDEGVRTVKELGGITFGLPQGETVVLEVNKQRLISEGVDFLLNAYEKRTEILSSICSVLKIKTLSPSPLVTVQQAS